MPIHARRLARNAHSGVRRIGAAFAAALCSLLLLLVFSHALAADAKVLLPDAVTQTRPLLDYSSWLLEKHGWSGIDAASSAESRESFKAMSEGLPLTGGGPFWMRLTMAGGAAADKRGGAPRLLMNLGAFPSGKAQVFFSDYPGPVSMQGVWQRQEVASGEDVLLPDSAKTPLNVYIRMDEAPDLWFSPTVRPKGAALPSPSPWERVFPAVLAAMGAFCLGRFLIWREDWSAWAAFFFACLLAQSLLSLPPVSRPFAFADLPVLLAPGLALMTLPHTARCLFARSGSSAFESGLLWLCVCMGTGLALLPLVPGLAWLTRLFLLWPLLALALLPLAVRYFKERRPGSFAFGAIVLLGVGGALAALCAAKFQGMSPLSPKAGLWGMALGGMALAFVPLPRKRGARTAAEGAPLAAGNEQGSMYPALGHEAAAFDDDPEGIVSLQEDWALERESETRADADAAPYDPHADFSTASSLDWPQDGWAEESPASPAEAAADSPGMAEAEIASEIGQEPQSPGDFEPEDFSKALDAARLEPEEPPAPDEPAESLAAEATALPRPEPSYEPAAEPDEPDEPVLTLSPETLPTTDGHDSLAAADMQMPPLAEDASGGELADDQLEQRQSVVGAALDAVPAEGALGDGSFADWTASSRGEAPKLTELAAVDVERTELDSSLYSIELQSDAAVQQSFEEPAEHPAPQETPEAEEAQQGDFGDEAWSSASGAPIPDVSPAAIAWESDPFQQQEEPGADRGDVPASAENASLAEAPRQPEPGESAEKPQKKRPVIVMAKPVFSKARRKESRPEEAGPGEKELSAPGEEKQGGIRVKSRIVLSPPSVAAPSGEPVEVPSAKSVPEPVAEPSAVQPDPAGGGEEQALSESPAVEDRTVIADAEIAPLTGDASDAGAQVSIQEHAQEHAQEYVQEQIQEQAQEAAPVVESLEAAPLADDAPPAVMEEAALLSGDAYVESGPEPLPPGPDASYPELSDHAEAVDPAEEEQGAAEGVSLQPQPGVEDERGAEQSVFGGQDDPSLPDEQSLPDESPLPDEPASAEAASGHEDAWQRDASPAASPSEEAAEASLEQDDEHARDEALEHEDVRDRSADEILAESAASDYYAPESEGQRAAPAGERKRPFSLMSVGSQMASALSGFLSGPFKALKQAKSKKAEEEEDSFPLFLEESQAEALPGEYPYGERPSDAPAGLQPDSEERSAQSAEFEEDIVELASPLQEYSRETSFIGDEPTPLREEEPAPPPPPPPPAPAAPSEPPAYGYANTMTTPVEEYLQNAAPPPPPPPPAAPELPPAYEAYAPDPGPHFSDHAPAQPAQAEPSPMPEPETLPRVLIGETVTVTVQRLVTHYLADFPHETFTVKSNREVRQLFADMDFSLIVLDADTAFREISLIIKDIRAKEQEQGRAPAGVLCLIGAASQESKLLAAGASSCLAKPFAMEAFLDAVSLMAPDLLAPAQPEEPEAEAPQTPVGAHESYAQSDAGRLRAYDDAPAMERQGRGEARAGRVWDEAGQNADQAASARSPLATGLNVPPPPPIRKSASARLEFRSQRPLGDDRMRDDDSAPMAKKPRLRVSSGDLVFSQAHGGQEAGGQRRHAGAVSPSSQNFSLPGIKDESLDAAMLPLVPGLLHFLDNVYRECLNGKNSGSSRRVRDASARLAGRAETFGLGRLGKLARCVERAARANDQEAMFALIDDLDGIMRQYSSSLKEAYDAFTAMRR